MRLPQTYYRTMPKLAEFFFAKLTKYIKGGSNHICFTSCVYKKKVHW